MKTESFTMNINLTQISSEMSFLPSVSATDCIIYRFMSVIFIGISIISFAFNIRFILLDRHRLNPLAMSLIVNSFLLSLCSLPYIFIQSIKCSPVQSYFVCCLQGFTCFTSGICVMYTMCLLSSVQYIRLFHNTTIIYRMIEHKYSYFIPLICWLISLLWSLPPFMNMKLGFKREGHGFDCGLNWTRLDISSHVYILLAFIFIYFIPLICLSYTHMYILVVIRKLVYRRYPVVPKTAKTMSVDMRHRLFYMFAVAESNRLKRLRIDRRFAQATLITVAYYVLAWTPYAVCGIIQKISTLKYTFYQPPPMLITASALTAKAATIAQSCVYFYTIQPSNRRFSITSAALK